MLNARVAVKKLNDNAILPTYGSEYAAGADLYACIDGFNESEHASETASKSISIEPGQTILVHTGLAMEIPAGYAGLIYARSGLATKKGLAPANKVGVVDADYRGEIMVSLHNHSLTAQTIEHGERIAQLVITPYLTAHFDEQDELSDTVRGEGGFGSTGSK